MSLYRRRLRSLTNERKKAVLQLERVSRIPAVVRLGVTGHRKLANEQLIRDSVRWMLKQIDELITKELPHSPHTFIAISPLAEGSDRLLAQEVLAWKTTGNGDRTFLEVALPMPEEAYTADFKSPGSVEEFGELIGRARSVRVFGDPGSREAAYESVGRYVVHSSDILIAIWDGRQAAGYGGTAEIVDYALKVGHPIIWIDAFSGEIHEEWDRELLLKPLRALDAYNGKRMSEDRINSFTSSRYRSLLSQAKSAGLTEDTVQPVRDDLLPKYARASLLSKRYQRYYFGAGVTIYLLSALAVGTVAIQALFFSEIKEFLWLEAAYMMAILGIAYVSNSLGWHNQWIDYRFLAERIRTAIFFTVAGIQYEPLKYPYYLSKSGQSDYWIVKAYSWIWFTMTRAEREHEFRKLKNFFKAAWMDDQIRFYKENGRRQGTMNTILEMSGMGLFVFTLVVALYHASGIQETLLHRPLIDQEILASIGIIFPAVAAALGGILVHREYRKNAERYGQMVAPMENIRQQVEMAMDRETLIGFLEDANELMLRENQDWRVNLLTQRLAPR